MEGAHWKFYQEACEIQKASAEIKNKKTPHRSEPCKVKPVISFDIANLAGSKWRLHSNHGYLALVPCANFPSGGICVLLLAVARIKSYWAGSSGSHCYRRQTRFAAGRPKTNTPFRSRILQRPPRNGWCVSCRSAGVGAKFWKFGLMQHVPAHCHCAVGPQGKPQAGRAE